MAKKSPTSATRRPAAKKKATRKKTTASSRPSSATKSKQTAAAPAKRYRFHRHIEYRTPVPNILRLAQTSVDTLWQNRRLFIGLTLTYTLLSFILLQGLSSSASTNSVKTAVDAFALLISTSATSSGPTAGPYQSILAIITSLAVIWALRQVVSGNSTPRVRDTFYQGMYPLVPFLIVLLVIFVQFLPFAIGAKIYATVITNGIAAHTFEKLIWAAVFIVLALWSLYMVTASSFALYIVTLPDMPPLKALRSARDLVRYRRWKVMRKILGLPLILLVIAAIIMIPIILILTPLAPWIFFLLTMAALVAIHTYMYTLYRELLNE